MDIRYSPNYWLRATRKSSLSKYPLNTTVLARQRLQSHLLEVMFRPSIAVEFSESDLKSNVAARFSMGLFSNVIVFQQEAA